MVVTKKALETFGGDRFELLIAASHRARLIERGSPCRIETKETHKSTVLALMEIEEGLYTKDHYINDCKPKTTEEVLNEHFAEEG